ncbi:MAG: hypothetical protein AAGF88_09150 [Pseudomonadota bacterium]
MTYPMTAPDTTMPNPADATPIMPASSYLFPRPGKRPLGFQGSELAMAMSFTPELPYWYEINIYRTQDQSFVVALRQFFGSETEMDRCTAWECESLLHVFDSLENYDAAEDIRIDDAPIDAMPAAELAAKAYDISARVAARRAHFASLIGELFAEMDAATQAAG